jgi:diphosphomevalonate decarboxylase
MTEKDFFPKSYPVSVEQGQVTWQSPSNIALVKYWGKLENQIPANPSISFTLDSCRTTTTLKFKKRPQPADDFHFDLTFEGEKKESFRPKIQKFLERIDPYLPFLKEYDLNIETSNSLSSQQWDRLFGQRNECSRTLSYEPREAAKSRNG